MTSTMTNQPIQPIINHALYNQTMTHCNNNGYIPTSTKQNKVVIYDWDDTLYPTTAFIRNSLSGNFEIQQFKKLSENVLTLIKKSCALYGPQNVFIVTNGDQGWVEKSLLKICKYCSKHGIENCFDQILGLITRNCITTISAKHLYSKQCPKQTMVWKYCAFNEIAKCRSADTMISFGDSTDEFLASQNVATANPNIKLLHRLKLISKPSIYRLNQQFNLIKGLLDILLTHSTNVTIDYASAKKEYSTEEKKC